MSDSASGFLTTVREYLRYCWLCVRAVLSPQRIPDTHGYATVTLTTYGPRQWAAMLAVDSLSRGLTRPRRVILFLDASYAGKPRPFPLAVLARRGVEIVCLDADYGSYKKLPLFAWYPGADEMPVITVDDDVLYPDTWLQGFKHEAAVGDSAVLCYRARRITFEENGDYAPYQRWEFVRDGGPRFDVLPNGAYGVLYRREALEAIRNKGMAFRELAPNADDLWFRLCTLEQGLAARILGDGETIWPAVPFTEETALWPGNTLGGGNDKKFAMIAPLFDLACLRGERGHRPV